MSKIADTVTAALLTKWAATTISLDVLVDQIEAEYTAARKRTGMDSYAQVLGALQIRHGVTISWVGPNSSGDCLYTFPAA